jgi:hypothetical protein
LVARKKVKIRNWEVGIGKGEGRRKKEEGRRKEVGLFNLISCTILKSSMFFWGVTASPAGSGIVLL